MGFQAWPHQTGWLVHLLQLLPSNPFQYREIEKTGLAEEMGGGRRGFCVSGSLGQAGVIWRVWEGPGTWILDTLTFHPQSGFEAPGKRMLSLGTSFSMVLTPWC